VLFHHVGCFYFVDILVPPQNIFLQEYLQIWSYDLNFFAHRVYLHHLWTNDSCSQESERDVSALWDRPRRPEGAVLTTTADIPANTIFLKSLNRGSSSAAVIFWWSRGKNQSGRPSDLHARSTWPWGVSSPAVQGPRDAGAGRTSEAWRKKKKKMPGGDEEKWQRCDSSTLGSSNSFRGGGGVEWGWGGGGEDYKFRNS